MVPNRFAQALSRLHGLVTQSRVVDVLGPLRPYSGLSRPELATVLEVFARVTAAQSHFGETERAMIAAVQLEPILDAQWWAELISSLARSSLSEAMAGSLPSLCARLELVTKSFPVMGKLLSATEELDNSALVLVLAGEDGETPLLSRVANALEGMQQLWTVAEAIAGQQVPLQLAATAPGPTTLLYFDGPAVLTSELESLLRSIYEQAARLTHLPPEQRADLLPAMLPIAERFGRSNRPEAARVRHALDAGVAALLQSQATLRGYDPAVPAANPPPVMPAAEPSPPLAEAVAHRVDAGPSIMSHEEISHLADVIAEERRALQSTETQPGCGMVRRSPGCRRQQ